MAATTLTIAAWAAATRAALEAAAISPRLSSTMARGSLVVEKVGIVATNHYDEKWNFGWYSQNVPYRSGIAGGTSTILYCTVQFSVPRWRIVL